MRKHLLIIVIRPTRDGNLYVSCSFAQEGMIQKKNSSKVIDLLCFQQNNKFRLSMEHVFSSRNTRYMNSLFTQPDAVQGVV